MTFLESRRLALREFDESDFEDLHAFVSNPVVCQYTDWGPNAPSDTRSFLAEAFTQARSTPRAGYSLAVVRKSDSRLIGSCAVWEASAQHGRGELGFVLHPETWGQGYASETARLLVQIGFGRLRLARLEATCRPENVGSRRALEKAGLQVEGLLRGHVVVRGTRQDSLLLGALRPS